MSEVLCLLALDKEEEERRRILENDSLLTITGGVDVSIWTRQVQKFVSVGINFNSRKSELADPEWQLSIKPGVTILVK